MERWIAVLMSVDEHYAAPLLVTVGSLLANLRSGVGLELYLMGHVAPEILRRIEGIWGERVRAHWVQVDERRLEPLRGYGYTSSRASYFRLLAGTSLPDSVTKVIYLDSDLLIQKDIFPLWEQDMHGNIVLAVQDSYLQRPGTYFNSGVMVIDLAAWRAAGIEQRCLNAAGLLRERAKWLDQQLANACLIGKWGPLPPVWNKQFCLDLFPDWRCSPYDEREFLDARRDPAIVHFCSQKKPWNVFSDHPREQVLAYRAELQGLGMGGLEGSPSLWQRTVEFFGAPHRRLRDRIAAAVRARRRAHAFRAMLPEMLRLAILHPWTLVSVPVSVLGERVAIKSRM